MADVIGPTNRLPGASHDVPEGTMCDTHNDRPATHRVQGETDSFGAELIDMCDECWELELEERKVPRYHTCEWCKTPNVETRPHRDFEEGMAGRVYEVCQPCRKREMDELTKYDEDSRWEDDDPNDYDEGPDDYDEEDDPIVYDDEEEP